MITGAITADLEAVIHLEVVDSDGEHQVFEAVVDTGFNGSLTLPGSLISALELPMIGNRQAMLADGSEVVLDLYSARIPWHEAHEHEIPVLQAEGGPLVGMELLYGNRVILDIVESGEVTINALP